MKKTYSVYKITNKINGKMYIGCTTATLQTRFQRHIRASKNDKGIALLAAIRKYGAKNFKISLITETPTFESMLLTEIKYIKKYQTYGKGYNMTLGGEGHLGCPTIHSKETIQKIKSKVAFRRKPFRVLSPQNHYVTYTGVREFCELHHLDLRAFQRVLNKKSQSHLGWRLKPRSKNWVHPNTGRKLPKKAIKLRSKKLSKTFVLINPEGKKKTYSGMTKFCSRYHMSHLHINRILSGQIPEHNGWKLP